MDALRLLDSPKINNGKRASDSEDSTQRYSDYVKVSIEQTYYFSCIHKCFSNYTDQLNGPERVCLAKCIDRAHDYMMMEKDRLNAHLNNSSVNQKRK